MNRTVDLMSHHQTLTRRSILAGLFAGTAMTVWPVPSRAQSDQLSFEYGWQADIAGPTEATFYVAPDGDDGGEGSLSDPFRTLQRGVNALAERGQGSLAIRGGIYREAISLDALRGTAAAPYILHRYGTEQVTITAADRLSNWTAVDAAEADILGTNAEGLFKATLPAGATQHDAAHALNLYQNGQWRPLAIDRADTSDPTSFGASRTYYPALFAVDTDDKIQALRDERLIGRAPSEILQNRVLVYHAPNLVSGVDIAGFDPSTGTIVLAEQNRRLQRRGGDPVMLYALQNNGRGLLRDHWMARRLTDGSLSVYLRPADVSTLEDGVEISTRTTCIDLGLAQHVELFGLNTIRASGVERLDGLCIRRDRMDTESVGLTLRQCRAGENYSGGGRGYGAVFIRNARGMVLRNLTITQSYNSFGLAVFGSTDVDMRYLHITDITNSPARFYTLRNAVLAFCLFENSARDAHANKFNFYEGSDNVLVYGVRTLGVGGYVTFQESSRVHFAFCDFQGDAQASGRALAAQNRKPGADQGGPDGSGDPVVGGTSYIWNNTLRPDPADASKANALSVGPAGTSQHYVIHNNILHGGGFGDIYRDGAPPSGEVRSHNVYSGLSFWQDRQYGWQMGAAEQQIRAGMRAPFAGRDMRDVIEGTLATDFPGFTDWDRDIDGYRVDWDDPPIGCAV